ncbi:MAG: ankyrin repeat domain-containing protein [Verrucomicrobiota bacterium]|nr:ankyrin repeat domain-containing protein [Verrucomicrobiota bacterium]
MNNRLINCNYVIRVRLLTELHKIICAVWLSFGLVACSNPEADRALIDASKAGNIEMLNLAISDWGNVDAKGGKLMATPLHYSTVHGHTPIVERLLDKGADVKVTDANGETPLHDAATFGRIEIVKMLLVHKADVNAVTPEKKTPLDYAIEANAENITDLLKQNGGKTGSELSIHVAAKRSDNKAIQQHLDAAVDVNSLDESGATPLDYAAKLDAESTANFLRQRGGKTSSELRLSGK